MLINSKAIRSREVPKDSSTVNFTRRQVEFINSLFPERILSAKTTMDAEVWEYFGTRKVVREMQNRIQD